MAAFGFSLEDTVIEAVGSSHPFQVIMSHLASNPINQPCTIHSQPDSSTVVLVSALHLLFQPIVQLHQVCTHLAHAALCRPSLSELELAFRNEARSAFLWLSCFLDDEEIQAWMATEGCPNCVTERVLSCDSTVRMTLAACLLAQARAKSNEPCSLQPDFSFFFDVVEHALDKDSFWGPGHHTELLLKAEKLCIGIQDMVMQAAELEVLVTSPSPSPTASKCIIPSAPMSSPGSIALRISPMAQRQQTLRLEERQQVLHLQRLASQFNDSSVIGRTNRIVLKDPADFPRKRSLTWQP